MVVRVIVPLLTHYTRGIQSYSFKSIIGALEVHNRIGSAAYLKEEWKTGKCGWIITILGTIDRNVDEWWGCKYKTAAWHSCCLLSMLGDRLMELQWNEIVYSEDTANDQAHALLGKYIAVNLKDIHHGWINLSFILLFLHTSKSFPCLFSSIIEPC